MKLSMPKELYIFIVTLVLTGIGAYYLWLSGGVLQPHEGTDVLYPEDPAVKSILEASRLRGLALIILAGLMSCITLLFSKALRMKEEHPYIEKFILFSGLLATSGLVVMGIIVIKRLS